MSDPYYDPNEYPQRPSEPPRLNPVPDLPPKRPPGEGGSAPWPSAPASGEMDGNLMPTRVPLPPNGAPATPSDRVRIGLWGAPHSGKTTYLAAVPIAAMQQARYGHAGWAVSGMNAESNEFLASGVTQLESDRVFPDATVGLRPLSWSFQGAEQPFGRFRRQREVGFVLEVQDVAGEVYGRDEEHALRPRILDQLARSQGLVYLFDPLLDGKPATRSLDYFYSMLNELNTRVRDAGTLHRNRLPHHVAVCVTKFDHPEVFRPAVEAGWVTQDSVGAQLPRVPAEHAARYFRWMCDEFRGSSARLVRDGLASFFHPERISYYVSSAIGFRLNPQHVFDYRNYHNVEYVDGVARICTSPVPVNVLEPLTDLERRIRSASRRRRPW
ncbi:hypothetical protein AQI95_14940 [Streptomyces yokosukanensis]|uniref:Uncharacterized protein n=1 Tax=Streptomyces yokosukanensis TaxID=67386 RepID=A0A101P793_9ACTN|nr:hypothetical protein [Streptomyces yokosukanensis]KUN06188.1 hypothetical protein AQI95_14940 [Streptomyces yokosukanensis]